MGVELRELRVFVTAVEEGSLSAAARRLHLSQSTVSQTVQALERTLGMPLLVRFRSGVTPTAAGRRLVEGARPVLAGHDGLDAFVRGASGESFVELAIPLEFPDSLLRHAIREAAVRWPDLQIRPRHAATSAQWDLLASGEIDVGLVRELRVDTRFDHAVVLEEPMGVLVAADVARRLRGDGSGGVRLNWLDELSWDGFSRDECPSWHDQVTATMVAHGIAPRQRSAGETGPMIAEVKYASVLSGSVFALAGPGYPVVEGVEWLPLIGNPLVRHTWAVWAANSRSHAVACTVAALEEACLEYDHPACGQQSQALGMGGTIREPAWETDHDSVAVLHGF